MLKFFPWTYIYSHAKKGVSGIKLFYWVKHICLPCIGVIYGKRQKIGIASNGQGDLSGQDRGYPLDRTRDNTWDKTIHRTRGFPPDRVRCRRYESCGHAGGLFCSGNYFSKKRSPWSMAEIWHWQWRPICCKLYWVYKTSLLVLPVW